jgi:hypothetical protein
LFVEPSNELITFEISQKVKYMTIRTEKKKKHNYDERRQMTGTKSNEVEVVEIKVMMD